jgi:hypothetical protein
MPRRGLFGISIPSLRARSVTSMKPIQQLFILSSKHLQHLLSVIVTVLASLNYSNVLCKAE